MEKEWIPAVWVIVFATALLWGASLVSPSEEVPWVLSHYDSEPVGDNYTEVFRLESTPVADPDRLTIVIDGEPAEGTWAGSGRCMTFTTIQPTRDFLVPIELRRGDGVVLWTDQYGAGSGTPITSDCDSGA